MNQIIQREFVKIAGRKLLLRSIVELANGEKGYITDSKSTFDYYKDTAPVIVYFPSKQRKHALEFMPKSFIKSALKYVGEYDPTISREEIKQDKHEAFKHHKFQKLFINHVLDMIESSGAVDQSGVKQLSKYDLIRGLRERRWSNLKNVNLADMLRHSGFELSPATSTVSKGTAVRQMGVEEEPVRRVSNKEMQWWRSLSYEQRRQYLFEHPNSKFQGIFF